MKTECVPVFIAGFLCFAANDTDRDKLIGYEYDVPIDTGVFFTVHVGVASQPAKGFFAAYRINRLVGNPSGLSLDPKHEELPGSVQESNEQGALIQEGPAGVELAIPLKLLKVKPGQTLRISVRELTVTNPVSVIRYDLR